MSADNINLRFDKILNESRNALQSIFSLHNSITIWVECSLNKQGIDDDCISERNILINML